MTTSAEHSTTDKRHPHSLLVDSRSKIIITGITDVGCFNDQNVEVITDYGDVVIKGRELHVKKVSLDNGEMSLEGSIDSVEYTEKRMGKHGGSGGGIFTRIFR